MAEASRDGYADALRREILRSERQRMLVLAIMLGALLATTTIFANFFPSLTGRLFRGGIEWWMPLAAIGPFFAYELVALALLRYRAATGRDFPRPARFANALVETSMPGVVILELSRHLEPQLVFAFWPPLLYFAFIVLSTLRLDFWLSLWTGAVAAIQQMSLAVWLLPVHVAADQPEQTIVFHLSRSIVLVVTGAVAGLVAVSLRRQFDDSVAAAASRDRVTNLFGQHVSPAVVERLIAAKTDPPSELRPVCVLFLDIRGFTATTRAKPPDETVALLNDFFAEMVAIVDRHNGIVNKFLGDGFLALFGAPLPDDRAAANALAAARAMLDAVDAWNGVRPRQSLRVGIGVHVGEAVTGTVGSPQRKEYTVIGDTVNLAARLEQLTKETDARLLVSQQVIDAVPVEGATDLGALTIRGYDEAVRIWKLA